MDVYGLHCWKRKKEKKPVYDPEVTSEIAPAQQRGVYSVEMSSPGGEPVAQKKEEEEDNFYDCHDSLEPPDITNTKQEDTDSRLTAAEDCDLPTNTQTHREEDNSETEGQHEAEKEQEDTDSRLTAAEDCDLPTNTQTHREEDNSETEGQHEAEKEQEDSDSEFKEDVSRGVELDEDYLREAEKKLTEEEKQLRRQQSLALKETGNGLFKDGDWREAELKYTEALALCPVCFSRERAVLFSNRAAARLHLELKDEAISDCSRAIDLDPDYLRALLRRAELYEQTDKLDEALEDYKKVLDKDPNHSEARHACMRLPKQIEERNEKLKEEMISKLKDLGNMILRPFGLSTNNFQVNQDTTSGSYSINFVQNPNHR
ncbi:tetratricopeptide repeat protein 1 [Austrofundulus limnaeus]|uniref:Tetratricopeptide repeat protein 1 n=1 Tax=Austrofundulus limnaeus TaxID=52670 RepID=A0A2I4D8Y9_AUSLI|nr:PREDICTED: tetratricopeptide repeat protein 1-like [Austrofundulus limnaeus]